MVGVSASVNLPLHHNVQKFSSGTGSPGWSRKKGRKTVVVVMVLSFSTLIYNKRTMTVDVDSGAEAGAAAGEETED